MSSYPAGFGTTALSHREHSEIESTPQVVQWTWGLALDLKSPIGLLPSSDSLIWHLLNFTFPSENVDCLLQHRDERILYMQSMWAQQELRWELTPEGSESHTGVKSHLLQDCRASKGIWHWTSFINGSESRSGQRSADQLQTKNPCYTVIPLPSVLFSVPATVASWSVTRSGAEGTRLILH